MMRPSLGAVRRLVRPELLAPLLALLPAACHLAALAEIFASRLSFAFDVEWMEGGQLYHAYRLLHGMPLFGPPDPAGFVPYGYPPLHPLVLAGVGAVAGVDYWVGRLLSILCFGWACAVLARE